jgi:hypothetical protein
MMKEIVNHKIQVQTKLATRQEYAIDKLLTEFHSCVDTVAADSEKFAQMTKILKAHNPYFIPIQIESTYPKVEVLVNVVAGVYAPFIHGFATTVVKNIREGKLPNVVIAPPRDAIPLSVAIKAQAEIQEVDVDILSPHVNRNTAGIINNQKGYCAGKSPYLDILLNQVVDSINGTNEVVEIEPGIYGTTSLIMAEAFKSRRLNHYYPIKFYGLGPNLSYVHAVLSDGKEWLAEKAETQELVNSVQINGLMVLLDTMEELGMEKFYQSVEHLQIDESGVVIPVIVPVSAEDVETANLTNEIIAQTALKYADLTPDEVKTMLDNIPNLVSISKCGIPLTLTEPIPPMDSKEEHYKHIRESGLFDYPELIL